MSNVPGPWEPQRAAWQRLVMDTKKESDEWRQMCKNVIPIAEEIGNICDMLENYLAQYGAYSGPIEAVQVLRIQVRKLLENVHRSE